MEMISVPKADYERMVRQVNLLRGIQKIDTDLVKQFDEGLNDLKSGEIVEVA